MYYQCKLKNKNDNTVVRKKNDTVCKKNEPCAKK